MNISIMKPGQEKVVIDIVREVFDEYVGPDFSPEGIEEFYKYADENSLARRSLSNCFTIIGYQDEVAVGVIEIRDMSHISMFFVKATYQHRGFGRELFLEALAVIRKNADIHKITVKSALKAVSVYERLGFERKDGERLENGIRFVPMEFLIE